MATSIPAATVTYGSRPTLHFVSGGFELYVPPTPFSQPPEPPMFVMLDDMNDVFYQVDYGHPGLRNANSWVDLQLHRVTDPAIVFPPNQLSLYAQNDNITMTGFLVSIASRGATGWLVKKIGAVHVRRYPLKYINWDVLASTKGPELIAELQAGLLRKVFNRRDVGTSERPSFVTLGNTINHMSRAWHEGGAALSYELDERFVGAVRIPNEQGWSVYTD